MARDLQRRHNFHRGIFGVPAGPFRKELVGSHRAQAISLGCQNVPSVRVNIRGPARGGSESCRGSASSSVPRPRAALRAVGGGWPASEPGKATGSGQCRDPPRCLPCTPTTTTPGGGIGRCRCDRRAQHRRFPRRLVAGSGVDRSRAGSSTSTRRQPEPLVSPMVAFWNPTGPVGPDAREVQLGSADQRPVTRFSALAVGDARMYRPVVGAFARCVMPGGCPRSRVQQL